jgi:hypothetical protein
MKNAGSDVLIPLVMNYIFWAIRPCSQLKGADVSEE